MKREVKYTLRMHFARSAPYDMTPEELRRMVGEETIQDIKKSDPSPFFKAWIAVHEGPASPQIIGPAKKKMVVFTRNSVKSAAAAIKAGLKRGMQFILGHNEDGAPAPKTGRVVAMRDVQMPDGKTAMIVAGYFAPDEISNAEKASAVSIEGVIEFVEHAGKYVANMIREITDIALLTKEAPGLPGAVALATLRASKNKDGDVEENVFEMKEIRRWIRQNNYRVEDFFEPDEIVGRRVEVNGRVEYQNAPAPVKRVLDEIEAKFGESIQALNADREKTAKEAEAFKRKVVKYEAAPKILAAASARKMPDLAIKKAESRIQAFEPDLSQDIDVQINSFLDQVQKDHEENVKLYGTPALAAATGPTKPMQEPRGAGQIDYRDPTQNPLLKV